MYMKNRTSPCVPNHSNSDMKAKLKILLLPFFKLFLSLHVHMKLSREILPTARKVNYLHYSYVLWIFFCLRV